MYGKTCTALVALGALVMVGCGSILGSNEEPKSESVLGDDDPLFAKESAGSEEAAPSGGPECLDSDGYDIECLSDKDCCSGFYCGHDPEGSTRVKTCLYGGG